MNQEPPPSAPAAKPPRMLRVEHPDREFSGVVNGLQFAGGVCQTTDAIKAHASQEAGCKVFDAVTKEPAWPTGRGDKVKG